MSLKKIYNRSSPKSLLSLFLILLFAVALMNACNDSNPKNIQDKKPGIASDGPMDTGKIKPHILGDACGKIINI